MRSSRSNTRGAKSPAPQNRTKSALRSNNNNKVRQNTYIYRVYLEVARDRILLQMMSRSSLSVSQPEIRELL